ncbi:GGDEF domain-containing response regulator [Kaarinaea lacus]
MEHTSSNESAEIKPTVLVIDDSKLVRVSIKRVLKKEFAILEAVDGEDGWEKLLANQEVQVVITDAGMPRLDGFELIQRIRKSEDNRIKDIPIMMVTGAEKAQTDLREKALSLGATDFITKPFDDVQMLARARTHAKLDTTQRSLEKTTHELEETSTVDPLTKISNRRHLLQQGAQALAFATRHKQALSFIGVGIDNFETIKSQYGNENSHQVQVWVAKLLQPILRQEDTIARIDNGVFAMIAPTATRMDAAVLAERMRKTVQAKPFSETVIALPVTISLGIVCLGCTDITTAEGYLNGVSQLVSQAQKKGGNRTLAAAPKQAAPEVTQKPRPSIDTALALLAQNNIESIKPYLGDLARQILPLLEMCNKTYQWQADQHITALKEMLDSKS